MVEVEEETRSSRKRRRIITTERSWKVKKARDIVAKTYHKLRSPVRLNDRVNIFPLLFPNPNDFLITNDGRQVREGELRGKTILLYMEPLTGTDLLKSETFHLIETYNELWPKGGFEVIFAPVMRGNDHDYSEKRFNDLFSHMPWPAVPFSNKLACDRIEHLSNKLDFYHTQYWTFNPDSDELEYYNGFVTCPWAIISPTGKVLLKHDRDYLCERFFNYLGGADCPLSKRELLKLQLEDEATLEVGSVINLNKLLATPSRDFLLTKDGNKVPISSLEDKVVGLYLCDTPTPSRMEVIKKVYQEALDLGYDFEIVQINFHIPNLCKYWVDIGIEDLPTEPCRENIPWLTVPFKDPCCRRLRRIFKTFKTYRGNYLWRGDRLVIINPHEPNIGGIFFDTHGAEIIEHFGIKAYPFMKRRVAELELARRRQDLKLQQNLGPLLLRGRGGDDCGFDRVPTSRLWGKRVLVVFAGHSLYKSCKYLSILKAKYLQQADDKSKFEVVYVSIDPDGSSFEECTKSMPWLVHPYSWDFACMCMSNLFSSRLSYEPTCTNAAAAAAFRVNGKLLSKTQYISCRVEKYPFMSVRNMNLVIVRDVRKIGYSLYNEPIINYYIVDL